MNIRNKRIEHKEYLCCLLYTSGYTSGDEEWEEYEKDLYSRYTDILLNNLQKLYLRTGRFDFMQEYSKAYWKQAKMENGLTLTQFLKRTMTGGIHLNGHLAVKYQKVYYLILKSKKTQKKNQA